MRIKSFVLILLICAINAQGATVYNWTGSAGDNSWGTASNWTPAEVPQDGAHLKSDCQQVNIAGSSSVVNGPGALALDDNNNNNPIVTVSDSATWNVGNAIWIADDPGSNGTLKILSGATVNIGSLLDVGNGPGSGHTADVIVDNGYLNVTGNWGDLRVGVYSGTSTLTVSGNSKITMIDSLVLVVGSATGTLTLNDGMIVVGTDPSSSSNNDGGKLYINSGGKLYYNGGKLLVSGNTEAELQSFIDDGKIVPSISYSITTMQYEGKSYTALVPEPNVIGLLSLSLGFVFRRK